MDLSGNGKRKPVIAIDVDGTLLAHGCMNTTLMRECLRWKAEGHTLMLWSSRGAEYAQQVVVALNLPDLFDLVCGKPDYIVDDQGWDWIRFTKRLVVRGCNETEWTGGRRAAEAKVL